MEHSESTRALVIDNGTGYIKAGFAGDEEPRVVFSTVIGRRSRSPSSGPVDPNEKEYYIGHKALRRNFLQTRYPIESGIIKNFDEMEKIWHHTFYNELRVAPEEYSVLLTESPWNINNIREKMTQTMFETFMTRGIHISISAVLSLNLSGNSTGVVVDSGDGATSIVPIHQGKIIAEPQKLQLTGVDLTDNLTKILTERGYWFTLDYRSREIARDMKENLCYVAQDYSYWDDINSYVMPENLARNYETLNGNVLAVGKNETIVLLCIITFGRLTQLL
jgi:actin-related protein